MAICIRFYDAHNLGFRIKEPFDLIQVVIKGGKLNFYAVR